MKDISKDEQLTFALSGCGRIAQRHARELQKYGVLSAACDPDAARRAAFCETFSCQGYRGIDELLENRVPDICIICSPNGLHAAQAIAALEKGCHVLCEKPFALSAGDCSRVIDAARSARRIIHVVHSYRYHPAVQAVREAMRKGTLGKISGFQMSCFWNRDAAYYSGGWKGTRTMDGGILYTQFSHFIDLLYWFFGDLIEARSFSSNVLHHHSIEFEDQGAALLVFPEKVEGSLHYTINAYRSNMEGSLTIFGALGTVKLGGIYCERLQYQQVHGDALIPPEEGMPSTHHDRIYADFIKAIREDNQEMTSALDGMHTVAMIEKICSSPAW